MDYILVATTVHHDGAIRDALILYDYEPYRGSVVLSEKNMGRQAHSRFRVSRWSRRPTGTVDALFLDFLRLGGWEREGIPLNGGDERLTADGPFLLPQG